MNFSEFLENWVRREFNAKYAARVLADMLDVCSGNRAGNPFELQAMERIKTAYEEYKGRG